MTEHPTRYHPLLVTIHWLMAALIGFNLIYGKMVLGWLPNDAAKLPMLNLHMMTGLSLGFLLIVRFIVRLVTKHPAPASTGYPILDFVGRLVHWLLYIVVAAMVLMGLYLERTAGLPEIFINGFPAGFDFYDYPPRNFHAYIGYTLFGLLVLHIGAAFFHLIILKDNLFSRMWYGKR